MVLSEKFEAALLYAAHVHGGQKRKGTNVPYLAHLMGVAALVLEYGGTEEEAVAALLHDAADDAGGANRLEDIRVRFGEVVAEIVDGCTDSLQRPKPAWRARKAGYIARIPKLSDSARLVSAADKLHNARALLRDLRSAAGLADPNTIWSRFTGGKEGTLWYNRCIVRAFKTAGATPITDELDRVVTRIEEHVGQAKSGTAFWLRSETDQPQLEANKCE